MVTYLPKNSLSSLKETMFHMDALFTECVCQNIKKSENSKIG